MRRLEAPPDDLGPWDGPGSTPPPSSPGPGALRISVLQPRRPPALGSSRCDWTRSRARTGRLHARGRGRGAMCRGGVTGSAERPGRERSAAARVGPGRAVPRELERGRSSRSARENADPRERILRHLLPDPAGLQGRPVRDCRTRERRAIGLGAGPATVPRPVVVNERTTVAIGVRTGAVRPRAASARAPSPGIPNAAGMVAQPRRRRTGRRSVLCSHSRTARQTSTLAHVQLAGEHGGPVRARPVDARRSSDLAATPRPDRRTSTLAAHRGHRPQPVAQRGRGSSRSRCGPPDVRTGAATCAPDGVDPRAAVRRRRPTHGRPGEHRDRPRRQRVGDEQLRVRRRTRRAGVRQPSAVEVPPDGPLRHRVAVHRRRAQRRRLRDHARPARQPLGRQLRLRGAGLPATAAP